MKTTPATPDSPLVGRFARSIESGWLGKVVGIQTMDGMVMCRMVGVNELVRTMQGGDIEDAIEESDEQWFTPEDLKFVTLV